MCICVGVGVCIYLGVGGYVCVCVCIWVGMGGGVYVGVQERKARGKFPAVTVCVMDYLFFLNPVCPGIIISLNAFDVALMFFLHFVFKLMSLQHLAELPCK